MSPGAAGGEDGVAGWAERIESGIFLVEGLPGLRRPPFERVRVRSFPGRHPLANIVGAARLSPPEAPATAARVRRYFEDLGEPFSWRVGPASAPPDLARHLRAVGLRPAYAMRGMAMAEIVVPAVEAGPLVVRSAGPGDEVALATLIERGYPASRDLAARLSALYLQPAAAGLVRVVLAELPGHDGPVGMGVCYDFPADAVAVLAGAATLPAFRGRGVYRGLLAHRLAGARRRGVRSAVIQAVADTSAPICRRLGFADLVEIQVLEWHPGPPAERADA